MLLFAFLGLIAKLALVLGDCDLGTPTLHDLDYSRVSGPRPWYVRMHHGRDTENNFDCVRVTISVPEGNRSLVTCDVYDKSEQVHKDLHGYLENWNNTGYIESSHSFTMWSGIALIKAVDYDRYLIALLCGEETHELSVYVGYRSPHPDQETVNEVHRQLQDKNVDVSQLVDWPADHCQQAESSAAGGSSA